MISIKNNIEAKAGKPEIWELFTRLNELYPGLSKNHVSLKCIEGIPNKIGSVYKVRNHFKGKILEVKYKLTEVVENERIAYEAEFPHALLGLKLKLNLEAKGDSSIIFEEIRFGTSIPLFDKLFDAILQIYLHTNLDIINEDQKDRLKGIRKFFEKQPEKVEVVVEH